MILVVVGAVLAICFVAQVVILFAMWRNSQVSAFFHAVIRHVYDANMAAIHAGDRDERLDWKVVERAMDRWDRMIFTPWRPFASWLPPEYRP